MRTEVVSQLVKIAAEKKEDSGNKAKMVGASIGGAAASAAVTPAAKKQYAAVTGKAAEKATASRNGVYVKAMNSVFQGGVDRKVADATQKRHLGRISKAVSNIKRKEALKAGGKVGAATLAGGALGAAAAKALHNRKQKTQEDKSVRQDKVDSLVKAAFIFKNHYKGLSGDDKAKVDERAEKALKKHEKNSKIAGGVVGGANGGLAVGGAAAGMAALQKHRIKSKAGLAAEKNAYATKDRVDRKAAKGSFIPKGKKTAADYIAQGKARDTKIKDAAKKAIRKVNATTVGKTAAGVAAGAAAGAGLNSALLPVFRGSNRKKFQKDEAKKYVEEQKKANKS